jgi:hypothetical protein
MQRKKAGEFYLSLLPLGSLLFKLFHKGINLGITDA